MTKKEKQVTVFVSLLVGVLAIFVFLFLNQKPIKENKVKESSLLDNVEVKYVPISLEVHECTKLSKDFLKHLYSYELFSKDIVSDKVESFGKEVWMPSEEQAEELKNKLQDVSLERISGNIDTKTNTGTIKFLYEGPDPKQLIENIQYKKTETDIKIVKKEVSFDFTVENFEWKIENPEAIFE